jgi:hypothetical protein
MGFQSHAEDEPQKPKSDGHSSSFSCERLSALLITQAPFFCPYQLWLLVEFPSDLKAAYSSTQIAPSNSTCLLISLFNLASWLVSAQAQQSSIAWHVADTAGILAMAVVAVAARDAPYLTISPW